MPAPREEVIEAAGREVKISNPDKLFFPRSGHTKLDLVRYYMAVSEGALRGVYGRPMALKRFVNGAEGEAFFQKRAPTSRPEWPKTSGSRGFHIYCRIEPRWSFPEVRRAAVALAREVERRTPDIATSRWWKEERHGVFLDYNQNAKDRTVASAYSVRPTPDARVSTPLSWDEVERCDPGAFTLLTVPARFAEIGDPSTGIDQEPGSLEPLLELSQDH